MKIVGIIPARGGSRSIPQKNIRMLGNKPLVAWTIEEALKSGLDRVVVSTDDPTIKEIAEKYGAEVPFLRPANLAGDTTAIEPVLLHAFRWLKENNDYTADGIAFLPPTSPVREAAHINEAIKIFENKKPDSVVSVFEAAANDNPHWMLRRGESGEITLFTGEPLEKIKDRRQELPTCYKRNDIIYILKPDNLYRGKPTLYGNKVELYIMDEYFDVDINTEYDWLLCEFKLRQGGRLS